MSSPTELHLAAIQTSNRAAVEGNLAPALEAARELMRQISSIPDDSPEARHPSYGIMRGLAHTMVDMLEEIAAEPTASPVPRSGQRARRLG